MKHIQFAIMALLMLHWELTYSQPDETDTLKSKAFSLKEIVVSVNKTEETKKRVAQQIQVLDAREISVLQSQTTADLLANSGNVFIQKSQLGGGSVTIRGFEANRTVLVIDGVRMNNLIYRAGHLQNIVTTDNNSIEKIEILFGPSSTIYGSDALGGVIHLYTKKPMLATDEQKSANKINFIARYGSVDNELKSHLDFNIGSKRLASLTSVTFSRFDDLKGGSKQNPFYRHSYGERPYYAGRINGKDSLFKNSNPYLQNQSGYSQYDVLQKFLFFQNTHLSHGLNLQYSNSTNIPRYDRLTDAGKTGLNYAEWYYGPQTRLLTAYDLNYKNSASFIQDIHFGVNYQNLIESRHSRKFNSSNLSHRIEDVNVTGTNLDFSKAINRHKIRFGFDGQFNTLKSTANKENIITGEKVSLDTRYPNGDNTMLNTALYFSHTMQLTERIIIVDGLRGGFSSLHSTIRDNSFFNLPYTQADQNNYVYSGNIGLINTPSDDWKLSLLIATGYRVPNIDDLSKVFESATGLIIVPNSKLKPEKTINYEGGITKIFKEKTRWENSLYYTQFIDAIITDKFKFNGLDSILYDGTMSRVMANQNKREAYIYGISSGINSQLSKHFLLSASANYTYGRIKTDSSSAPLDHIPPFMSRFSLSYSNNKFSSDFFINYNGWKKIKDYYLNGEDNEQYATIDGMPAWFTANVRFSYRLHRQISLQTGVDNIFDTQYRTFASGINGAGRNIFATLKFN